MARHRRSPALAASLTLLLGAACAATDHDLADRAPPPTAQTTFTVPTPGAPGAPGALGVPETAGALDATTATAATAATLPLTTAPPSPILDDVATAYRAAYDDLLAAEAVPDPEHPALDEHIAGRQLAAWRRVIGQLVRRGQRVRAAGQRWLRIERLTEIDGDTVDLVVCRFDPDETMGPDGQVVATGERSHRYIERFDLTDRGWAWTARTWLDDGPQSDCAWPG